MWLSSSKRRRARGSSDATRYEMKTLLHLDQDYTKHSRKCVTAVNITKFNILFTTPTRV